MDRSKETIWVEKYRPETLDTYIGNEAMKAQFARYIADQDVPHLLLVGPPGTGKTTAAKILLSQIPSDTLRLNASLDNNIDTVRTRIASFASTLSFTENQLKLIFLDEFDGFTLPAQNGLRGYMEKYPKNVRFILTANHVERIIDPIQSRSQVFKIVPPSKTDVAKHVAKILKGEGVEFDIPSLKLIVDAHFPDIRRIIGDCQRQSVGGKLSVDQQSLIESDGKLKLVEILKSDLPITKQIAALRQLIADSNIRDFSDVYRLLYDRVTEIAPKNIPAAILAIGKGQLQDSQVVDKEINMICTLIELIQAKS